MTNPSTINYRTNLQQIFVANFDLGELQDFCFGLDKSLYENLSGKSKKGKVRQLIIYLDNRQELNILLDWIVENRPFLATKIEEIRRAIFLESVENGDEPPPPPPPPKNGCLTKVLQNWLALPSIAKWGFYVLVLMLAFYLLFLNVFQIPHSIVSPTKTPIIINTSTAISPIDHTPAPTNTEPVSNPLSTTPKPTITIKILEENASPRSIICAEEPPTEISLPVALTTTFLIDTTHNNLEWQSARRRFLVDKSNVLTTTGLTTSYFIPEDEESLNDFVTIKREGDVICRLNIIARPN